ncbi:MAG: Chemotaxis protein methyltransferase [uncultured bacterium]|nr:MAG: Chemotaxis protein methyltransferase [uncultured bacterium]HLD44482.1 protein-glutamate O-methyltransferase CheR [bacterium]
MRDSDNKNLITLLTKIYQARGLDFTQYKISMVQRRVRSRMLKCNVSTYEDYFRILDQQPDELGHLIQSFSIQVTELFRNPESFNAIRDIVIPQIIISKREKQHKIIKAWSCGCSTGDEPYSLAMLFLEKLGAARDRFILTILGTDIDDRAIREAGDTEFEKDQISALNQDIIRNYFVKHAHSKFKIADPVRNLVRLRHHDVINDIPYMHCDVILCRNVLIYFNKELQQETQLKFYDCLNPGGFLVLGMTESLIGSASEYFEPVNNSLRIYRRPIARTTGAEKDREVLSQNDIDRIIKEMTEE